MKEKFIAKPKTTAWKLVLKCEQFSRLKSSTLLNYLGSFLPYETKWMSRYFYNTELEFASFLSEGFTRAILVNGQE